MKKRYLSIFLLSSVACYTAQESNCGTGPTPVSPNPIVVVTTQPTPTPTPFSDSGCSASCSIAYLSLEGADTILAVGGTLSVGLTPFTEVKVCDSRGVPTGKTVFVKTSKECDDPRAGSVVWASSSPVLQVTNLGFLGEFKRLGLGESTISASLEGKVVSRVIR